MTTYTVFKNNFLHFQILLNGSISLQQTRFWAADIPKCVEAEDTPRAPLGSQQRSPHQVDLRGGRFEVKRKEEETGNGRNKEERKCWGENITGNTFLITTSETVIRRR